MTTPIELNLRMPFMRLNWSVHTSRVHRLTYAERGMFDAVRAELWTVVGCKLPREVLMARLRIKERSKEAALLDALVQPGLLTLDADGLLFDELQVAEFEDAIRKSRTAQENGKRGGRPAKTTSPGREAAPSLGPGDF